MSGAVAIGVCLEQIRAGSALAASSHGGFIE
jgi:hypothetical protein